MTNTEWLIILLVGPFAIWAGAWLGDWSYWKAHDKKWVS